MSKMRILTLSALSTFVLLTTASRASAQPAPPAPGPDPKAQPAQGTGATGSSALTVPETPPSPPVAGTAKDAPAATALPKTFADEASLALRDGASGEPVAGWHDMFFIRDPEGNFRLSPVGDMMLDFHSFLGHNVDGESTAAGGSGMPPGG